MQSKNISKAIFATLFILWSLLLLNGCGKVNFVEVTIYNNSDNVFKDITVRVMGEEVSTKVFFEDDIAKLKFEIKKEGTFEIVATFTNGKELKSEGTYLTKGLDIQYKFRITDDLFILTQ
ncbi:MAG: hypothetical protein V7749_12660 [Cocleimonas sp.]